MDPSACLRAFRSIALTRQPDTVEEVVFCVRRPDPAATFWVRRLEDGQSAAGTSHMLRPVSGPERVRGTGRSVWRRERAKVRLGSYR